MSKNQFASGQCLCGDIQYTISSEPLSMAQCHCDDCRKSTGTGHASNVFFNKSDVDIQGQASSYTKTSDSGSNMTRYFCGNCGSRLFGTNDKAEHMMSVTAGCLDDSSWFKAKAIVYNKRKPVWDIMDDSIPTFEEMPPAK